GPLPGIHRPGRPPGIHHPDWPGGSHLTKAAEKLAKKQAKLKKHAKKQAKLKKHAKKQATQKHYPGLAQQRRDVIECAAGKISLGPSLIARILESAEKGYKAGKIAALLYKKPTRKKVREVIDTIAALDSCARVSNVLDEAFKGIKDILVPPDFSKANRAQGKRSRSKRGSHGRR
ncbi:hypothetical protein, partial [Nonomuraea sp. NPDC050405]|uniref:hypothetical protein n=1 Tax=Nonomuraea sp. NPDC050405 TaxID=3154509 RepID=UPI0033EA9299